MSRTLAPGMKVRVRDDYPPGHIRTPVYIRGHEGVIVQCFGAFENPEVVAYRLQGPKKTLYAVRFRQADLWPGYDGQAQDTLDIDIYEHWLEPA